MLIPFQLAAMAPKGSPKGMRKATARAMIPTSIINQGLSFDQGRISGFISEHIRGLIWLFHSWGVKDDRKWDIFYDVIVLDPVTTRHFSQFPLMWHHCRSRSSPFREWLAALCSLMGQMSEKTSYQMNNRRWDNPSAFRVQVDHSNLQTTRSGHVNRTREWLSSYRSDDLMAQIDPPSCRQNKHGDFLVVGPLNWDERVVEDHNEENFADPRGLSGGRWHPGDGNDNNDGNGEEDS